MIPIIPLRTWNRLIEIGCLRGTGEDGIGVVRDLTSLQELNYGVNNGQKVARGQ